MHFTSDCSEGVTVLANTFFVCFNKLFCTQVVEDKDTFVICGDKYLKLRNAVRRTLEEENTKCLSDAFQVTFLICRINSYLKCHVFSY